MDKSIVDRILKLNSDFYQFYAQSFSDSRSLPWKGWGRVVEVFNKSTDIKSTDIVSVLDLGSGNSRFFEFLHTTLGEHFEYTGTDQCPQLLEIANKKYSKYSGFHTTNIDVIKNLDALDDVYDLVCAFGVTHHIPSSSLRDKWFRELGRLVNKNGFLVLSFWYTDKKSSEKYNGVLKTKLEQGDFILGWGIGKRYFRYVHIYSDGEISKIIQTLKTKGLELVDRFDEDFNSKSHNLYLIFKKNL